GGLVAGRGELAEPIVRILFQGAIAAEIPATALADNTPIYHRTLPPVPEYARQAWEWHETQLPTCTVAGIQPHAAQFRPWNQILLDLLETPTIASKRWIYRQYDHQVQNNTVVVPGAADAAIIRLRPQESLPERDATPPSHYTAGVAATVDCNPRYVYLHPYEGAKMAVAEAARNLSCVGAEPLAVTDNLNFGSPETAIGYWQLAEACRGLAEACQALDAPVTGGNVSLYNETLDANGKPQAIYPTPVVGMVGLVADVTRRAGQAWQAGHLIYLLGFGVEDSTPALTLGGSEYLASIHRTVAGMPPLVDFEMERCVQAVCRTGIQQGWVRSAHDCAEGGLAIALAESCVVSQVGAMIQLPLSAATTLRLDRVLFGEGGGRILVSIDPGDRATWESTLHNQLPAAWQWLGTVELDRLQIRTTDNLSLIDLEVNQMGDRWLHSLERRLTA
ncbi:MAG: phosphoribosylformylglycinamidine synthase II, partial [Leptolyngbyaceae cyanobacterium SL_7_1]|nr:phosphoribosylformylglycinamidine synthase II [Leptolyngbyaceae cyanobacterium SL_7_1]